MKRIIKRSVICLVFTIMGVQLSFGQHRPDGLPQGHSIGNGGIKKGTANTQISSSLTPTIDLWDGAKVMEEV